MRVLVVGGGGREHALVWKLAQSPLVDEIHAAPGNPGIAEWATCHPVDSADVAAVVAPATHLDAHLTVVGPEIPLVAGLVDALEANGRLAFGPRAAGARLEGSKQWMKEVLVAAGVPTARYAAFGAADEAGALAYLESMDGLYVIKTDGLAAGKGVLVTESMAEARDAVRSYLGGEAFGDAGRRLVIEEGLSGPELSLLALTDGNQAYPLPAAQDHKRVGDGDTGPNTGGMGAYSPVPVAPPTVVDEVMARAVEPTLAELQRRGIDYRGILYAGLMLTPTGVKVIEYNVRFGDPECQVVVPRLATDLAQHCLESARGELVTEPRAINDAAVTVIMAAQGYPASPRTGDRIAGLDLAAAIDGVVVFHAGTAFDAHDHIVTAGGRVVSVTALAPSIADARDAAYRAVDAIDWPGAHCRRDIGSQALTV